MEKEEYKRNRAEILGQVRNPLIFFALALLVIEGVIGVVVATSKMTGEYQFYSVCLMTFLFLVVVIAVVTITIKWPRHLYEEVVDELQISRYLREFINSTGFKDAIEDVLVDRIKPECLGEQQKREENQ